MDHLTDLLHVDIDSIAAWAGVHVHKIDFRGANARRILARACKCPVSDLSEVGIDSALLQKNVGLVTASHGVPHIFIHRYAVPDRRWLCGHELGHYLLGHVGQVAPPKGLKYDAREAAADWVAAQLLIPTPLLQQAVCEHGKDVRSLAALFGVHSRLVSSRLAELGIAEWGTPESEYCTELPMYPW